MAPSAGRSFPPGRLMRNRLKRQRSPGEGGTAIVTVGMGAYGLATSKDLARWIRPLSFAMLGLLAIGLLLLLFGSGGSPLFSLAVLAVSAAFLIVDFNYLRRHATEDDVIWLATGIFVSIVNIFLSLLNLFGGRN